VSAEGAPITPSVVQLGDAAPRRWRNGGGVTRELPAWPSPQEWRVRVSVADVEREGPFSSFPGVDRWFAVIDGAGVAAGSLIWFDSAPAVLVLEATADTPSGWRLTAMPREGSP